MAVKQFSGKIRSGKSTGQFYGEGAGGEVLFPRFNSLDSAEVPFPKVVIKFP